MDDDLREWLSANGINVDADGVPVRDFVPGPPRPCLRCGVLAEGTPGCVLVREGGSEEGGLCDGCYRLSFSDPKAFFRKPAGGQDQA